MIKIEHQAGDVCYHCYGCASYEDRLEVLRANVGYESDKRLALSPVVTHAIEYIRYSLCVFFRYVSWLTGCKPRP